MPRTVLELNPEIREAWEKLLPHAIEVEYLESGSFQGGEEECFVKGAETGKTYFVFSPGLRPFQSED